MKDKVLAIKAHISLNVTDISKSIEFYQKLFGIEPSKIRRGYAKFDVENPPLNLALNEKSIVGRGSVSHLGIQVASSEDVLETKNRWEELGLKTKDEMQTECCYALQDKTWTRDPDGNEWEVFVVIKDNLPEANMCRAPVETETISESQANNSKRQSKISESLGDNSPEVQKSCC